MQMIVRCLKKSSVGLLVVLLFTLYLQVNASPVNVVEVANFYCPECYAAEQVVAPLRQSVTSQGGHFDFVPIFYGNVSPWPAKVYLSLPKSEEPAARHALFSAAALNGLPMASAKSACSVVTTALKKPMSLSDCVDGAMGERAASRLKAVLALLKHVYPSGHANLLFPLFVVLQDGQIRAVLSRHQYPQIPELVKEVQHAVG